MFLLVYFFNINTPILCIYLLDKLFNALRIKLIRDINCFIIYSYFFSLISKFCIFAVLLTSFEVLFTFYKMRNMFDI